MASGFDLSTAVPVSPENASPPTGAFDLSTATPVDPSDAPPETFGRVAGLAGRAVMTGIGQLEDMPRNLAYAADAAAVHLLKRAGAISQDYQLPTPAQVEQVTGSPSSTSAATQLASRAGLPTPATPGERIGSAAVAALPSAVLAPEAPIVGALSAAAGGAASQGVAEAGGSPLAQTLTGLAVGGAPAFGAGAAGLARTVTRGAGDAAAQATAQRIANAQAAGVNLTAGQATGSRLLQQLEGASSKFWGGGPIKQTAEQQAQGLGEHVDNIVENLSQGTTPSPTAAGEAINKGAAAARQTMKQAEQAAYSKVDSLVDPSTPVDVSGTLAKLDELATPTAGAEATTGSLIPPRISQLRDNLAADMANGGGGTTLPYSAVRQLRTAVGREVNPLSTDPANGSFKQLYGTLTDDMNAGAAAVSPEASQAVNAASSLYKSNQARRDFLDTIVDKAGGPEAVYQAATNGTKLGATKIAGVMSAIDPQSQNLVRATVISRLGRSISSQQNDLGTAFSADTFLTNWDKLSPEAKNALFGSSGSSGQLRTALDSLEQTASVIRKSTIYKNPSGTGEAIGHGAGLFALLEGAGHALTGSFGHLATVGGAIAGNAILSRALVNPRTAQWLARTTKLPRSAIPGAVRALAQMGQNTNDPDARELAAYLQSR